MTASRTSVPTDAAVRQRAQTLRQRIRATVERRAPQVMVKVTGGGREGREALRPIAEQWRFCSRRISQVRERREAFNIMLSMPAGTEAGIVQRAAREFAKAALANRRYVMVLPTHQANPHVHISVRAGA